MGIGVRKSTENVNPSAGTDALTRDPYSIVVVKIAANRRGKHYNFTATIQLRRSEGARGNYLADPK